MTLIAPTPLFAETQAAQLMMLVGFILLGWVLVRRQIQRQRRSADDNRAAHQAMAQLRSDSPPAMPLSGAPVETQRWQVALFDLQRELKAELDTRIVIVQTLLKQADQRIDQLSALQSSPPETTSTSEPIVGAQHQQVAELFGQGHTAEEIAAATGLPLGDIELTIATMNRD